MTMLMKELSLVEILLCEANTIIMDDCEAITIESIDSESKTFCGIGEETGESYQINFDEVNPETDIFYKEEIMNEKDYIGENGDKRREAKELFASLLDKDVNSVLNTLLALSKDLS